MLSFKELVRVHVDVCMYRVGESKGAGFSSSAFEMEIECRFMFPGAIVQSEQMNNVDYMPDYGLFEASRIACPVLPQYHPKQLMELLNSGKIRWVKAILAHLVRLVNRISKTFVFYECALLKCLCIMIFMQKAEKRNCDFLNLLL
jgi:hypothetical protein